MARYVPAEWRQFHVEPKLVLYSMLLESACGFASSAVGPFYCPDDQKVYIDLSFYQDLKYKYTWRFFGPKLYVIMKLGIMFQNLLGISDKVRHYRIERSEAEANQLSVNLELQADCFVGVWGNHAQRSRQILRKVILKKRPMLPAA